MVLKGSSLYVSAALVPQNASKFYAEWSSHALFVLFQALWWHCLTNRCWKLTIKEVVSCATLCTCLYEMCEGVLGKNQNVSYRFMFLVFTGFRARLGMTMTDKRSHGGRDRIQEQGEIVGPSHFVPTHRIASQRWFETCPGWFMRLQFCHNRQIPQSFHFKKLLQCSEGWHEQQAKHGKTKCSNIRLSYPGFLEPALAYVSGTCLGWHAAFGIARCRSATNDKGPKKSGWFCLTLLSQATGQSFDMFSWPGLAPGIGQRSHRALGQFACSVGRATSRWIRFQTNASMQILGHLWTETGNILDIHVWHFDYDDHQTSQDVARKKLKWT